MADKETIAAQLHAEAVVPALEESRRPSTDMAGGDLNGKVQPVEKVPAYDGHPSEFSDTEDGQEPNEHELATLRKVADHLPISAWFVAAVELCERFAYYGLSGPFQNYMQRPYGDPKHPGALGLGQAKATALSQFFQFWCYVTPIIGAIVADQYLGKYNTILLFSLIYIAGLFILFFTSLPSSIEHGHAYGGLVASMIVIGLGTGGIKSNVSPLIAEQYKETKPKVKTLKNGERVIVDPAVTIQSIYMIFYMCINVGSLSSIATTELELHCGFWTAYLLPLCIFFVGLAVLIAGRKSYVVRPPQGSIILYAFRAMWVGIIKGKGDMDAAKPSAGASVPWSDLFVDEIKRALVACRVFIFYPIYWVVYGQMINNFVSQAGVMETHGIPNDIMQNIDPLTIIIFIPICDKLVYPMLRKFGIKFKPITRITWGFLLGAVAMAYAAIVQNIIYNSPPCYRFPMSKTCLGGDVPNKVHVAVQTPAYLFIGLSEIFASITGLEYAYTKAPPSMKSFVMAMFLFTNAFGAALGIALSPTAEDPKLVWMYTGLAIASAVAGVVFWFLYKKYNDTEEEMNALDVAAEEECPRVAATEVGLHRVSTSHSQPHVSEKN